MAGKTHSRALMAQVWSQNWTRTTRIDIMRKCEFAQRLASRCTRKPDHIRDDSGLRREAMRRKLGLGFLATRAEEASASCAGDIFFGATKRGTVTRSKQNTTVITPCETWSGGRRTDIWELVPTALDLIGPSWTAIRHRLDQGTVAMNNWAPERQAR